MMASKTKHLIRWMILVRQYTRMHMHTHTHTPCKFVDNFLIRWISEVIVGKNCMYYKLYRE